MIPKTNTFKDPSAAKALVSARPSMSTAKNAETDTPDSSSQSKEEKDIQRAKDLIELHYSIKVAHENGDLDRELSSARDAVRELNIN
jgi:hypothetical protein